jgi:hypothetical protein
VTPWTPLVLRTTVVASAAVDSPIFGMALWLGGQLVYSVNTRMVDVETGPLQPGERRQLDIHFTPALSNGRYQVSVAAAAGLDGGVYDWVNHATTFLVAGARCGDGFCDLGAEFTVPGAPRDRRAAPPEGIRA